MSRPKIREDAPAGEELRKKLGAKAIPDNAAWADVAKILRDGVLVKLHLGRPRSFSKLEEDDLGLVGLPGEWEGFAEEYLRLGRKALWPREIIRRADAAERAARATLEEFSFETAWGRFVPVTAFDEWTTENQKRKAEYMAVLEDLIQEYQEIRERVRQDYFDAGRVLWERLRDAGEESAASTDRDAWAAGWAGRVMEKMPTPEQVREAWSYEERMSFVPLPGDAARQELEAERARRQPPPPRLDGFRWGLASAGARATG